MLSILPKRQIPGKWLTENKKNPPRKNRQTNYSTIRACPVVKQGFYYRGELDHLKC